MLPCVRSQDVPCFPCRCDPDRKVKWPRPRLTAVPMAGCRILASNFKLTKKAVVY